MTGNNLNDPMDVTQPQKSQEQHRQELGMLMDMMARKFDRYGWDQMETPIRTALIADWMDALQGFPLSEVRAACVKWTNTGNGGRPAKKAPTEGDIRNLILSERQHRAKMEYLSRPVQDLTKIEAKPKPRVTPETANRILAEAGYSTAPTAEAIAVRKAARDKDFCPTCGSRDDYSDGHCFECEERAA